MANEEKEKRRSYLPEDFVDIWESSASIARKVELLEGDEKIRSLSRNERERLMSKILEKIVDSETEKLYERLSSGEGLAAHYRSVGRVLCKYGVMNQRLVQIQRPGTLGVATEKSWKKVGRIPSGESVLLSQSFSKTVPGRSKCIETVLKTNPALELVDFFEAERKRSGRRQSFGEYVYEKASKSPRFKDLAKEMDRAVDKLFAKGEEKAPERVKLALRVWMGTKFRPVAKNTRNVLLDDRIRLQDTAQKNGWEMYLPSPLSKGLVDFFALLLVKTKYASLPAVEQEKKLRSFKKDCEDWNKNIQSKLRDEWKKEMDAYSRKKESGEEVSKDEHPGPFPLVESFSTYGAYAFEDTVPDPEAERTFTPRIATECDESLWNAVRDSFRTRFQIEETQGNIPDALKKNDSVFRVSLGDTPGTRVLAVVREWGRREAAKFGAAAPLFTELLALSAMTSIGMDNPHADQLAILNLPKEDIRRGLEESEKILKPMLGVLGKRTEKIVSRLLSEMFSSVEVQNDIDDSEMIPAL